MARLARLAVVGYPHLVFQRGMNGQAIFAEAEDYRRFLALLAVHAKAQATRIHAHVLMPGAFQLLLTPDTEEGLPRLIQSISRVYVQGFNRRNGRRGALWEGRYRATVLEPETFFRQCMTYVDLSSVRAGLVLRPQDHPWSSCHHYLGEQHDPLLSPHALYWAMGNTPFDREAEYKRDLDSGLTEEISSRIERSVLSGWALGTDPFIDALQKRTKRRLKPAKSGRPALNQPNGS